MSCKVEDQPLLRNGSTRRPTQEGWVLSLLGPEDTVKPRCSRVSQAGLHLLSGQPNSFWSLSHVGFILVFIRRWLEENVTNQHFNAAGSGSEGCGKSKEQRARGLRKDRY